MTRGAMWLLFPMLFTAFAVGVIARADEPAKSRNLTRAESDSAIAARAILREKCLKCHGGDNKRTPWSILDHANLTAVGPKRPVPLVKPKFPDQSQIIQFVEDGSMPPGRHRSPLTQQEVDTLKKWITAGAPSFPIAFDDAYTLNVIRTDLLTLGEDAARFRYLSFTHLLRDDPEATTGLASQLAELEKALEALGGAAAKSTLTPLDSTGTVFRFDISKLGWNDRELFYRVPKASFPFTAYDLLLFEYPHGVIQKFEPEMEEYFAKANLARPISFLRADWVTKELQPGSPLPQDLKSLTELHAAFEKAGRPSLGSEKTSMPCGSASRPFGWKNPVPAFTKMELQSPILPLSAWYAGDVSAIPSPIDVTAELVNEENTSLTTVQTGTRFKLKVDAKQQIWFRLLMVSADGEIRIHSTNQDGFLDPKDPYLKPTKESPFSIDSILTGEPKGMEYFVLLASATRMPPITVFRSRHEEWDLGDCTGKKRFPVWRFQFDLSKKPDNFDPAKVVRRVIPIPIEAKK